MFYATLKTPTGELRKLTLFAKDIEGARRLAQKMCNPGWTVVSVD